MTLVALFAMTAGAWADEGIVCTADDLGKVICTDGSIYATVSAATAAGKTAVAKIFVINTQNKSGMAMALADEGELNWSTAQSQCSGKTPTVAGATWKFLGTREWKALVNAAGGGEALRTGFASVGGTDMQNGIYWINADGDADWRKAVYYNFTNGEYAEDFQTTSHLVRAALTFKVKELITLSEDRKTATIESMPGSDVTVDYELVRDMEVDMTTSVGDGTDGYRIRLQKDGQGKYVPAEMTPQAMASLITVTDNIENADLTNMTDYTIGIFAVDEQNQPTGAAIGFASLAPGSYVAIATAADGSTYEGTTAPSNVFVLYEKHITVDPVAGTELVYNGQPQALAADAECEGGEMRYSLDGETWSAEMPTVTDAGTYTLYYKVVTGDDDPDTNYSMIENIVVAKAELASATLVNATLIYDTFNHLPLTAEVSEVKAGAEGTLTVPAEDYTVSNNTATDMGDYTATITAKADSKNFTGEVTVDFSIVKEELLVDNDNVPVTVTADPEAQTLTIDEIGKPLSGTVIHIPAEINGFKVTKIAAGALGDEVTDIYMPDTGEEPILVEAGAFPATAIIHTTLALLDDYALMSGLQPNYEATKVMTTVTPKNSLWTLSSGVDVLLPEGVTPNRVELIDGSNVGLVELTASQLNMNGENVLKACNGVLMVSTAGQSYDLMAHPGRQASGSAVNTDDAKDYGTNLLIPVIVPTHFESGDIYIMKDNKFRGISDTDTKVSACKAVLKAPAGASLARVLNIIGAEVTKLESIDNGQLTIENWYDLNGRKLDGKPTKKGLYIMNGKKVVVK